MLTRFDESLRDSRVNFAICCARQIVETRSFGFSIILQSATNSEQQNFASRPCPFSNFINVLVYVLIGCN